jgi:hypothetical protein
MDALGDYVAWILFAVMTLFGLVFAIVAVLAYRRANREGDRADAAAGQLAQMTQRAQAAEAMIAEAQARAQAAEQRIMHAESGAQRAIDEKRAAEQAAADAARRAREAAEAAQRADASLRERKDALTEKQRQAEQRARSLLEWAKGQWEARREPDRQRAQGQQGNFQAQLDAFLELRRQPVSFRVENEIDRAAAPLIAGFAPAGQQVDVQGDLVRISYPVDPSLGFRA